MSLPKIMLVISALLFTTSPLITTSEPVLDTDGHPIRAGERYYVVPPNPGTGGGLTLAPNKGRCPYEIIQIVSEPANGLPVIFSPSDKEDKNIEVDNDINIRFVDFKHTTKCTESKVWKFDTSNQQEQGSLFVTVGGSQGNPGPYTLTNWFKIEKNSDKEKSYKFQYCPSADLCDKRCGRPLCGDVGVKIYNGRRRLAVNQSPLSVVFKKAHV